MSVTIDGATGITTPGVESEGQITGTTGTFSGDLTLGTSVLATPTGSAPSYTCRAWVNFNGTGTVAIRASGNVTSITDNGVGDYTVNFTTAIVDSNFCALANGSVGGFGSIFATQTLNATSSVRLFQRQTTGAAIDLTYMQAAIFR